LCHSAFGRGQPSATVSSATVCQLPGAAWPPLGRGHRMAGSAARSFEARGPVAASAGDQRPPCWQRRQRSANRPVSARSRLLVGPPVPGGVPFLARAPVHSALQLAWKPDIRRCGSWLIASSGGASPCPRPGRRPGSGHGRGRPRSGWKRSWALRLRARVSSAARGAVVSPVEQPGSFRCDGYGNQLWQSSVHQLGIFRQCPGPPHDQRIAGISGDLAPAPSVDMPRTGDNMP
jgi:hypothetical protein